MKRQIIPALVLAAMLLVSPSSFAAQPDAAAFVCPNQNPACAVKGACVNHGQCINASGNGCSRLRNVAVSDQKSTACDMATAEFVCPRGNSACIENGACYNGGQCQPSANVPGNGSLKRDGTGAHHGGQGRGHHGGNRGHSF